ncbi:MAG: hypothetical protein QW757_04675, partial [Candidatus Woesearchaeota archaeon]
FMTKAQNLDDFLRTNGTSLDINVYEIPEVDGNKLFVMKNSFCGVDVYQLSEDMYNKFKNWLNTSEREILNNALPTFLISVLGLVTYLGASILSPNAAYGTDAYFTKEFSLLTSGLSFLSFSAIMIYNDLRKPDFVKPIFSGNQKNALQYLNLLYQKKEQ